MEFKDYPPEELVGKSVLWEYGQSYAGRLSQSIRKIASVHKRGFRVLDRMGMPDKSMMFDFAGRLFGSMGSVSRCKLITDEQADEMRNIWADERKRRVLQENVREIVETRNISMNSLQKIYEILVAEIKHKEVEKRDKDRRKV